MKAEFHKGNRERLYAKLPEGSLLVMFSGEEITKTNDEYYPFFADRSFVYLYLKLTLQIGNPSPIWS